MCQKETTFPRPSPKNIDEFSLSKVEYILICCEFSVTSFWDKNYQFSYGKSSENNRIES